MSFLKLKQLSNYHSKLQMKCFVFWFPESKALTRSCLCFPTNLWSRHGPQLHLWRCGQFDFTGWVLEAKRETNEWSQKKHQRTPRKSEVPAPKLYTHLVMAHFLWKSLFDAKCCRGFHWFSGKTDENCDLLQQTISLQYFADASFPFTKLGAIWQWLGQRQTEGFARYKTKPMANLTCLMVSSRTASSRAVCFEWSFCFIWEMSERCLLLCLFTQRKSWSLRDVDIVFAFLFVYFCSKVFFWGNSPHSFL